MVDIEAIRTILRVNGLSAESPQEDIERVLLASGYSADDLGAVSRAFSATPPLPQQVSVPPILPSAQVPIAQTLPTQSITQVQTSMAMSPWRLFLGWLGVCVIASLTGAYALRVYPNLTSILKGYEGSPQIINQFILQVFLPGVGFSVVILLLALLCARRTNVTQSLGGWLSVLLSWYAGMWLLVLSCLLYVATLYAKTSVPDWMSFGFSLLMSFGLTFVQLAFVATMVIALVVGLLSYLKRPKVHSALALKGITLVVFVGAIAGLTYYSGVMRYPAELLKVNFLCYAIAGASSQQGCVNASVGVGVSRGNLDVTETRYVRYGLKDTSVFVGNDFIFVGNRIDAPNTGPFLVRAGKEEPLPDGVFPQEIVVADGKLVHLGFNKAGDRYKGLLYVNGVRDSSREDVEAIAAVHGKLAIFERRGEQNSITWNGKTFTLPSGKEIASGTFQMRGVGTDSIAYAYTDAEKLIHIAIDGKEIIKPFTGGLRTFEVVNGQLAFVYEVVVRGVGVTEAGVQVGTERHSIRGAIQAATVLEDGIAVLVGEARKYVSVQNPSTSLSIGGISAVVPRFSQDPELYKTLAIEYNGTRYGGYDRISVPQNLKGKLAFATQQGNDIVIYVAGKEYARFPRKGDLAGFETSPGGRWLVTMQGEESSLTLYVDGELSKDPVLQAAFFGEHVFTSQENGRVLEVFADGVRLGAGFSVSRPKLFEGKMLSFGVDTQSRRAFIISDPGLLSPETKERLR